VERKSTVNHVRHYRSAACFKGLPFDSTTFKKNNKSRYDKEVMRGNVHGRESKGRSKSKSKEIIIRYVSSNSGPDIKRNLNYYSTHNQSYLVHSSCAAKKRFLTFVWEPVKVHVDCP